MSKSNGDYRKLANKALQKSAELWFLVAASGLIVFSLYALFYYVIPALLGGLSVWIDAPLPTGAETYIVGDIAGNWAMAAHLFIAVIIMAGGLLQLIPYVRTKFPAFHRWNGRVYIVTAILTSIAGFYMVWGREAHVSVSGFMGDIAITIDGILIIFFAVLAWRTALKRDFKAHRKWALRLFMVVNAVWFIRVGYRSWLVLMGGNHPYVYEFFQILNFAQYLLPLALLELYFLAQTKSGVIGKFAISGVLVLFTVLMGIGIFAASVDSWIPKM